MGVMLDRLDRGCEHSSHLHHHLLYRHFLATIYVVAASLRAWAQWRFAASIRSDSSPSAPDEAARASGWLRGSLSACPEMTTTIGRGRSRANISSRNAAT